MQLCDVARIPYIADRIQKEVFSRFMAHSISNPCHAADSDSQNNTVTISFKLGTFLKTRKLTFPLHNHNPQVDVMVGRGSTLCDCWLPPGAWM